MRSSFFILCLVAALATADGGRAETRQPAAAGLEPWTLLLDLRSALIGDSPLTVEFDQTFTPAGFSAGDTESGSLAISLPNCLRWDYYDPFPRSFLLCRELAYSWNPGEASGRRYRIADDERHGLDLLRLDVDTLRLRYSAEIESHEDGFSVFLQPLDDTTDIRHASLTVAPGGDRLLAITYEDVEGNTTSFALRDYTPSTSSDLFAPPIDVEWIEN